MPDFRRIIRTASMRLMQPQVQQKLRNGVWGIADHGLMSLSNFVIMVILARALTPRDLGLYALAFTVLVFMNGVQTAIVSQPHTMLGSPRTGQDFVRYTSGTLVTQIALAAASGTIIGLVAYAGSLREWTAAPILMASAFGTVAWQLQDFIRRVLYTRSRTRQVFINDVVSYGGQLVAVAALWRLGHLTPASAMLALAGTSILGTLLGLWQSRSLIDLTPSLMNVRATAAVNWNFGKWLLGGNLAAWTSGRIYPLLAAGLVSVAATGTMKAVQTIMGPTHILKYAMDPLMGPHVAKTYARDGIAGVRPLIARLQLLIIVTLGAYCLLVALLATHILNILYGDQYSQYAWLLIVLAVTTTLAALRFPLKLAITAIGETSSIFRARVISSVANLTLGLAAVYAFGFPGVAIGIVMDELIMQLVVWRFYLKYTSTASPTAGSHVVLEPTSN